MIDSKEKILLAAIDEFHQMGYAGARVDKIAERSGLNKAMIYYHFKNKENLYTKVLETLVENLVSRMQPVLIEKTGIEELLKKIMDNYSKFLMENPKNPKIFFMEIASGGFYLKNIFKEKLFPIFMSLKSIIEENISKNEIRDIDYKFTFFSVISPFILFFFAKPIFEILIGKEYDEKLIDEFKEYIFETVFYGIKKR